jgi:DNA polymerase-3 subunit alpha
MVQFPVERATNGRFKDNVSYWRHLLKEAWTFRGLHKLSRAQQSRYKRQIKHEMELIEAKNFVGYFLLVRAGVVFVKDVLGAPVGPARGSSASSVVAWMLRITEVDPLRPEFAGLLDFGRFISHDRWDLPDIDLDFPSEVRPALRDFYVDLMGGDPERVNNVGTFMKFKGRNSLDDVARVYHVPPFKVQTIKDFLIERSSGDLRASSTVADTIAQFEPARKVYEEHPELGKADLLEGNVKSFGVHAAALVLSNDSITTVAATLEREIPKGSGNVVTCVALDKKDAERQGLVKMDFLGLNTMSMLWNCLKWIGKDLKWLYALPLDDPRVYALLQAVDVTGLFQMEGRAQRYVCAMVKPVKFSEIMDCGALCRPGPLHNGAAKTYGEIKAGGKIEVAPHPALVDITSVTQFQIVYQEQVLKLARIVGGFDDMGVSTIRRLISRKEGEQAFNRSRNVFMDGVRTLHKRTDYPPMSDDLGGRIWGDMITSGAYAFNAPHCAAYGLITYFTAYMKVYHPAVFYAAALYESVKDKDRTRQLLRDADHHGVRVLKPDLQRSSANWAPVLDRKTPTIRAGFQSVEGIGDKVAPLIAEWRDERKPTSWNQIQELKGFGPATVGKITSWIKSEDPFGAFRLDTNIQAVKAMLEAGELLDRTGKPLPIPTHSATDLAADEYAGKALHVFWLGTFVAKNIRNIHEQNVARGQRRELSWGHDKRPDLAEWAMLTGEDGTDQMLVKVTRFLYPKLKDAIFNFRMGQDLLLVEGVKPARSGVRSLTVKKIWVINPGE